MPMTDVHLGSVSTISLTRWVQLGLGLVCMMSISSPLFVLMSGIVFFGWGEVFSLFPSTLTDTFGTRHATRNYGCLCMAQGIGAIFGGPMASLLHDATGTWTTVFGVGISADILTAVLAIVALKPMRARYLARN